MSLLLLLLAGLGLMAFGLFWFIGGLQGGFFGADLLLGGGMVATLCGFGLLMVWLYDRAKKKDRVVSK